MLHLGQGLPNVQPDQTPVDTSGFWGGLRHGISLLGEAAGSPWPRNPEGALTGREGAGRPAIARRGSAPGCWPPRTTFRDRPSGRTSRKASRRRNTATTPPRDRPWACWRRGRATPCESQQADLEKLKAALPLLSLQQQLTGSANTQKLLSGQHRRAGDGTYVGAIGGHEGTGQNPGSSAVGTGQFLRDTWLDFAKANPQYFQGMSEKQILDARTVPEFSKKVGPVAIEWLAKQNADALTKAGVPPSGPVLGIAHYVGAGAAANIAKAPDSTPVARFVGQAALDANPELRTMTVGQMKARYANTPNPSFMSAPAPGQAGAPAPASLTPSAPGAKTQIPPPTVAAPGQATHARPRCHHPLGAASAGRYRPDGGRSRRPGAPTSGVIPTLPPAAAAASAADVAQIEAGMANAQANP